jgi:ribosome-associated protein
VESTRQQPSDGDTPAVLVITAGCRIPRSSLSFRTSRSGGPGGQHVNKVETRVELLFDVAGSPHLSEYQRTRILDRLRTRIDAQGLLHVVSGASRSQWQNKERAVERFVQLMREGLKPRAVRKKTRPSASAREKRLHRKKERGETKRLRRPPKGEG